VNDPRNPSLKDRVEYLVLRRFPSARAIEFPPSINAGRGRHSGASAETRKALADYRSELAGLSLQELIARYNAEQQRNYEEIAAKAEKDERERFFNQPYVAANFIHWSKMAHWTQDEAVALSFGKAPEHVNWQAISKYLQLSQFAVQYQQRRELAMRAAQWKQLYDPVLPGIFLAWAKGLEIEVPAALVEAVQKRGPIRDWKSLYDELKTTHADREASWTALGEAKDRTIVAKDRVVAVLEERVRNLEAQQTTQPPEKQLGARERESLLKVVIGMAVGGYSYDPGCVKTFFRPQKLLATGDDPRRHDGLSIFLLYRVWSQPGRNLGPR
jgi:hypothetical protein